MSKSNSTIQHKSFDVLELRVQKQILLKEIEVCNAKLGNGFKSQLKYGKNYRGVIHTQIKQIKTKIKFIDVKLMLLN